MEFCLAQAASIDEGRETWLGRAKSTAYNIGANTWPGWDEPGITITTRHLESGVRAARRNLSLAGQLERPADKVAMAHWLVGAHAMAAAQWAEAARSFGRAVEVQPEDDAATHTSYRAYRLLATIPTDPTVISEFESLMNELLNMDDPNGPFYAQQIITAQRVLIPNEPIANVQEEPPAEQ